MASTLMSVQLPAPRGRRPGAASRGAQAGTGRLAQPRGGGARACRADGGGQCGEVVGALVALTVDEEARRAGDAAGVGAGDVFGDVVGVAVEVVAEASGVEPELAGVAAQVQRGERILVIEQLVVHGPEGALGGGGLGPRRPSGCSRGRR